MIAFEVTHDDIAAMFGALAILGSAAISGVFLYVTAKMREERNGRIKANGELARHIAADEARIAKLEQVIEGKGKK